MRLAVITHTFATALFICAGSLAVAAPERPAALDGSQYTVVASVYDGSGGAISYLRLFNGGTLATTFKIIVFDTANGVTLGAGSIQIPAKASVQYPLTPAGGDNSIFTQLGVAGSASRSYALYMQNADALTGYQHVTYNPVTTLFENSSVCAVPINQQLMAQNSQVLTNIHTTALSGYPSTVFIHNYASTSIAVTLTVYDAATGANLGHFDRTIAANATLSQSAAMIQSQVLFAPSKTQLHMNVVITNSTGGALPVAMTQSIHNAQLGGDISMTATCAMNALPPVSVAYCGTTHYVWPDSSGVNLPTHLIIAVPPNGKIQGAAFGYVKTPQGPYTGYGEWDYFTGSVLGSSFSASGQPLVGSPDSSAPSFTGSIQSGTINGRSATPAISTFSATPGECN